MVLTANGILFAVRISFCPWSADLPALEFLCLLLVPAKCLVEI